MKKIILSACALSAMFLTSCSNEVDMFETIGTPKATIELNISNDKEMQVATRATQQVSDNSTWFATLDTESQCKVSDLINRTYTPGSYNLTVSNYANLGEALKAYEGAGDMYFEGAKSINLEKGTNTITMDCGTAKNAKLTVNWSGTSGVTGLKMTNVKAKQTSRDEYTYNSAGTDQSAYFKADEDITCTINYIYNNESKTLNKTFSSPAAATEYKLNVSANTNGTITTITINYDKDFANGGGTSITIDAATGNKIDEVETPPSAE